MTKREEKLSRFDEALVLRVLDGDLPGPLLSWAARRIQRTPRLKRAYDELRLAEGLAAGVDVTEGQARLMEHELFALLDEAEDRARSAPRLVLPLAGFAAAAAAAVVLFLPPGASGPDGLQARSSEEGTLGAQVRCLELNNDEQVQVQGSTAAGPGRPGNRLVCGGDTLLGFSFTNLREGGRHVLAVGIGPDDELRWYAPFGPDAPSQPVAAGSVDQLLDTAADLNPMPSGENVHLFFLFSEQPFDGARVVRALDRAQKEGLRLYPLARLPIPDVEQARIELARPEVPQE